MAKEVEIIVKATDQASSTFDKIGNKSNSFADKIKANLNTIRIASWVATTALIAMWKKFIDDANNSIEQTTKLTTVLKQRTNATDEQIKKIQDLTSAQQKLWVVEDDVQMAWLQQLGTFVSQAKSLEKLWPAMNNLIAQQKGYNATAGDATNIWNLMWKVLQWQTSALTRVGITFTEAQEKVLKFGNEEERASMLAQVITDNVGNMNEALWNTFQWRMTQLNNTLGDVRETIGMALIPIVQKLLEKILPVIQKITERIEKNPELTARIFAIITAIAWLTFWLSMLAPMISKMGMLIWLLWSPMGLTLLAVWALAYWFYQLFTKFPTYEERMVALRWELTLLDEQFKNWTITQEQYNQKTEEVKAKMTELEEKSKTLWWTIRNDLAETVNSIKNTPETLSNFVNAMWAVFDWLAMKIGEVFLKIWEFFNNFWLSLQIIFENMWSIISGMIEWLFNQIQSIWDQINTMIVYALWVIKAWAEAIKTAWKWLWDWIKLITTSAYDWIVSKFNALTSFISWVVSKIKNAYNSVKNFISWWWSSGWKIAGARAEWWPVKAGKQYLVGERWPEMFVPNSSWNIIPNEKLWWQTGSQTININLGGVVINNEADETRLVEKIKTALTRESQLYLLGIN